MSDRRTIELTAEQIAFLRDSLMCTAQHFRELRPRMEDIARTRRAEVEKMIPSLRAALADASDA